MVEKSSFERKARCRVANAAKGIALSAVGPHRIDHIGASLRHCFVAEKDAANADFANLLAQLP